LQTQATSDCNAVLFVDGTSPLAVKEKCILRTFLETSTEHNTGSKKALTVWWLKIYVRVKTIIRGLHHRTLVCLQRI